ncbi:MAG: flavin reductase family protein, partial [Armatimonadota bacterium]|nr:flavin reductase family protein [Armatimonadota bacterium]
MGGAAVVVGIAVAPARYSHQLIREAGEFVLNLPTAALAEKVDRCGTTSGRTVNKFDAFGLTPLPALRVRPPLVAECPLNLECRVIGQHSIGDHDLFLGEVLVQHVDAQCMDAEGRVDVRALDPLCYVRGEYYRLGEYLGRHGFTRRR